MDLPVLKGIIDRRILINYRVKPDLVRALLPSHLEPIVVNGYSSAGICLLRLKDIGLKHSPSFLRIDSENAAHRFLVTFKKEGMTLDSVYIPRRDTDSRLNVVLAGKFFSWPHYAANFQVDEKNESYSLKMKSKDCSATLEVEAHLAKNFPPDSMFESIAHASACFQSCSIGISPSLKPGKFKAIQLRTKSWSVQPLHVVSLRSSYFEDLAKFPEGTIQFDNALLMQGIEHEWVGV